MAERSRPLIAWHASKQLHPAGVQGFEQEQRDADWCTCHFWRERPGALIVRPDRRVRLRQRQLQSRVGVEVTLRDVVDDLAHRPSAIAIRRVELCRREALDGRVQLGWRRGDGVDRRLQGLGVH